MLQRPFGTTGLHVSAIGLGAGHIGDPAQPEIEVDRLLHGALALGITLIDTARGYGASEDRIGRLLAKHRDRFVLSSKCGYGIAGHRDWTGQCIAAGIDEALKLLHTDRIDIMHLHSCPAEVLRQGDVIEALQHAQHAGKVRVVAYSGENADLEYAIECGAFGSIQCSVNVCDQRGLDGLVKRAAQAGLGVIAKRPLANAFWRHADRPEGNYCLPYWERARAMNLAPPEGMDWAEFAMRFAAYAPGVSSVIVGTGKLENLRHNTKVAGLGPLPAEVFDAACAAFQRCDADWVGQV